MNYVLIALNLMLAAVIIFIIILLFDIAENVASNSAEMQKIMDFMVDSRAETAKRNAELYATIDKEYPNIKKSARKKIRWELFKEDK